MQIAILSVLKGHSQVIAYWQIAETIASAYGLKTTEGAVRGALERMFSRGFIIRSRAANGKIQGNRYAFSSDPCPYIHPYVAKVESGKESGTDSEAQSGESSAPSILKEKTDRENLLSLSSEANAGQKAVRLLEALSEDDIAYHWPRLAKAGFGTFQIRQIVNRLGQVGNNAEQVMQGLRYAEWELEHKVMLDKSGSPVASPVDWVFSSLAKTGYYRRPKGYVSPEEQAELDAAENAKQLAAAMEARKNAEMKTWTASLSSDERKAITTQPGKAFAMPDDVALKLHFNNHIWPKILAESKKPGDEHAQ
jgi:hypothetical protein